MNRNLLFTSLMLYCSVMAISQQAKHSCFTNNLIVGDSIRYDLVDIEKLCIPENDESTWNFSNLKYLEKEREVSFYGKDSAKVRMIGQDEMLDFVQTTAGLYLSQIQTSLVKIDFVDTFDIGKIILPDNESLSNTLLIKSSVNGVIIPLNDSTEEGYLRNFS